MNLTPQIVDLTFRYCLYNDDEVVDGKIAEGQPDPKFVQGLTATYGFHPERIAEKTPTVRDLVAELPESFHEGMSFLAACNNRDGDLWTGSHLTMDQLFCLGMATGVVECCAPREMWSMLPEGMPYYKVTL